MKHELPSFAVLIDADNVRLDTISPILEEITRHGRVTVRRIYGDFTSQNLAAWKSKLAEHAIHPIQQYRNTIGKNASDSALIIDAMDLLHSRRFEGFCLVSSDSDFTRLATRIREDGLMVFGFGEKKAPKAFVNACDRYIYVENLLQPSTPTEGISSVVEVPPAPKADENIATEAATSAVAPPPPEVSIPTPAEAAPITLPFRPPALARPMLERAYNNVADEQGWALLGQMSTYIHANHSDFDSRTYGCAKFIDLVQKTCAFELVQRPYKNGQSYFCRPKEPRPVVVSNTVKKQHVNGRQDYASALKDAVSEATAPNGWASIAIIGQKLKGLGRTVKESGHATLTDALKASGLFEMRGSGAARYFRIKPSKN